MLHRKKRHVQAQHIRRPTAVSPPRTKVRTLTIEQASAIQVMDLKSSNRTEDRIRFVEHVHGRFLEFLRGKHPELGAAPLVTALTLEHAREFSLWLRQVHVTKNPFSGLKVEKSAATVRAHLVDLRAFSRFCSDEGILPANPLQKLKLPIVEKKVIETFKAHHLKALLEVTNGQLQRDRNRAMIYLLLATGLRATELCSLTRGDIDIRSRSAKVMGKGRKERLVRFDATTAKLLARLLAEREDQSPEARVFVSRYGKPLNRIALYRVIDKLGTAAGITDVRVSPHTFRHCFAINFLRAHPGALFHLMELMGHSDLAMTRKYARVAKADASLDGPGPVEALGLDQLAKRW